MALAVNWPEQTQPAQQDRVPSTQRARIRRQAPVRTPSHESYAVARARGAQGLSDRLAARPRAALPPLPVRIYCSLARSSRRYLTADLSPRAATPRLQPIMAARDCYFHRRFTFCLLDWLPEVFLMGDLVEDLADAPRPGASSGGSPLRAPAFQKGPKSPEAPSPECIRPSARRHD